MGQMHARPEDGQYGIVTVANESKTNTSLEKISEAKVYWTIPFFENSYQLEESRRGTYFSSEAFTLHHPSIKDEITRWKFRLYPHGEETRERGLSLFVEPLSTGYGRMEFSATPLQMGGRRLEELRGGFETRKMASRDAKASGLCLGGYRQVLESVKKPKSQVTDVLYVTFEVPMKLYG